MQTKSAVGGFCLHKTGNDWYYVGHMKPSIIWTIVIVAILGAVFGVYKLAQAPASGSGQSGTVSEVTDADQTRGPKDSKVVLVEYSDFECPACAAFYPQVEELNKELGGKLLFAYRHFPLPQHKNAELAAYAAEAAGKQGKFWEMHSMLFENQSEWSESKNAEEIINKYAESVGLNMEKFKNDIDSSEIKDKVASDKRSALRARVNSTPTFFLNGEKMEGFKSYDEFKNIVREAVGINP